MLPIATVIGLKAAITGNVSAQAMVQVRHNGRAFGSIGIDGGGRVDMLTATTADVLVQDANGKVLCNATVTADITIAPVPEAVQGPLTVTVTNISNAAHTLAVYWAVKK